MSKTGASTRGTAKKSLAKSGSLYRRLSDDGHCLFAAGLAHSAFSCLSRKIGNEKTLGAKGEEFPASLNHILGIIIWRQHGIWWWGTLKVQGRNALAQQLLVIVHGKEMVNLLPWSSFLLLIVRKELTLVFNRFVLILLVRGIILLHGLLHLL